MGMWISLTKYPMKPMTKNPTATALHNCRYSVSRHQLDIPLLCLCEHGEGAVSN